MTAYDLHTQLAAPDQLGRNLALLRTRLYRFSDDQRDYVLAETLEERYLDGHRPREATMAYVQTCLDAIRHTGRPLPFPSDIAATENIDTDTEIAHRRLYGYHRALDMPPPERIVAVLGAPRSGTSHLVNLLARQQWFAYLTTVSCWAWPVRNLHHPARQLLTELTDTEYLHSNSNLWDYQVRRFKIRLRGPDGEMVFPTSSPRPVLPTGPRSRSWRITCGSTARSACRTCYADTWAARSTSATWRGQVIMTQVLAPLAARYAGRFGLPAQATADTGDEDPVSVRAMPLILRLERDEPPPRSALLEAAGSAAVALCLDERSQPGGPWHPDVQPWLAGPIRKVTRRARGAQWRAVTELPGITIERHGAQVRALLPWQVADTPRTVTRLQVSGTDVPPDEPGPPPEDMPVLWIVPALAMTVGKAAAQVGHATMLLAALLAAEGREAELDRWAVDGYRCAVRTAAPQQWAWLAAEEEPERAWRERRVLVVRDAGFTEVAPGTVTVAAHWRQ